MPAIITAKPTNATAENTPRYARSPKRPTTRARNGGQNGMTCTPNKMTKPRMRRVTVDALLVTVMMSMTVKVTVMMLVMSVTVVSRLATVTPLRHPRSLLSGGGDPIPVTPAVF